MHSRVRPESWGTALSPGSDGRVIRRIHPEKPPDRRRRRRVRRGPRGDADARRDHHLHPPPLSQPFLGLGDANFCTLARRRLRERERRMDVQRRRPERLDALQPDERPADQRRRLAAGAVHPHRRRQHQPLPGGRPLGRSAGAVGRALVPTGQGPEAPEPRPPVQQEYQGSGISGSQDRGARCRFRQCPRVDGAGATKPALLARSQTVAVFAPVSSQGFPRSQYPRTSPIRTPRPASPAGEPRARHTTTRPVRPPDDGSREYPQACRA